MLGAPPGTIPRCGVCGRHRQSDEARKGNRSHREHGLELGLIGRWIDVDLQEWRGTGTQMLPGVCFRLEDELSH